MPASDPSHPDRPSRLHEPGASLAALTASACAGDRAAFDEIHDRLAGGLRRLFLQRASGREAIADDLAQRTWMAVWKAFSEGKYDARRSAVTTFLYAVGYKVWLQHLRSAGRTSAQAMDAESLDVLAPSGGESPEDAVHLADAIEAMRACLRGEGGGALDEQERYLVTAAATGVPDRELAKRIGVAPSTLNVRKQAAMAKVRRYLAARGFRASDSAEQPGASGE